ncbi:MAG: response regulator [Gammaproteobacteria bacterium]|nr:response regulator [Gammaproteobacteria bacterium]
MSKDRRSRQTVFVVEDDEPMRDALALALGKAGYACETFPDATGFLNALTRWPQDRSGCLVLDIFLPDISGLDLQDHLSANADALPIIFITGRGDIPMTVRAMKGGAVDVLPKPFRAEDLLERTAAALCADAKRRRKRRARKELRDRLVRLTPREKQVFERIAGGQANKAVAIDFGISERTVEIHRSRVMKKMQARNLADLVRMKFCLDGPQD